MRKILIVLAIIITQFTIEAQIKTPQSSPKAAIDQVVGLTDVEIVYSRPSARGRAVFGNLVPFGELWRTGANENTMISFSDDVVIDGKILKKGKYALYTIPNVQSWEVIFYMDTDNWGTPKEFNEENVALRTIVKEDSTSKAVETFTIAVNGLGSNFAYLEMSWENSLVSLKFEVPTQKNAMASIDKVLSGPTAGDYFSAAQFYFQSNLAISKARTYVDKALEMSTEKPFYFLRLRSLILAKQGDKKGAIETAKLSIIASEAANNADYVKMNKDSIAEWSK
jgi:hypothetical protein